MQAESDHQQESSNNNYHRRYKSTHSIRNRRKIYDDNDFKEVVKNFYNLISEINKVKKISKIPIRKQQQSQPNKRNLMKKQQLSKELPFNRRDMNIRPDIQQAQQFFNQTFSQQLFNQLIPASELSNAKMQLFQYEKTKPELNFKRNQYHIQIAYQIYIKKSGSGLVESQDPTLVAKKVMNNNLNSTNQIKNQYQNPEEEKQSDVSELLNKSFEEGKKKPLKELVRELQSDQ